MLPKKYRLAKNRDFEKIYKYTSKIKGSFLSLRYQANNLENSRFGFVVPNYVSKKSSIRNRFKRQMREGVKIDLPRIKPGFDVIIKMDKIRNQGDFNQEVDYLFQKAHLLND